MCLLLGALGLGGVMLAFVALHLLSVLSQSSWARFVDVGASMNEAVHSAVLNVRAHDADYAQASLRAMNAVKDRIAVVVVDDETLQDKRFNEWPIPRSRYAEMIAMLDKAGVRAVGIDVLFLEPQKAWPKADAILRDALARSPSTILVDTVYRNPQGALAWQEPLPLLTEGWSAAERRGRLGVTYEGDESVRSVPLVVQVDGEERLAFDTLLAARLLDVPIDQIVDRSESGYVLIGPKSIPVESGAMTVNFFWPGTLAQAEVKYDTQGDMAAASQTLNYYPLSALWDMDAKDRTYYFKDRIVLLGVTAQAGHDIKTTPIGKMAGVEVHANALLTILSGAFVEVVPQAWVVGVSLLLCLLIGATLPSLDPRVGVAGLVALEAAIVTIPYKLFEARNVWFPPALSFFSVLAAFALITIYLVRAERRAKMLMKSLFERATPVREDEVMNFLLSGKTHVDQFETALEVRERTVLFQDIRDYTVMSESMDADKVLTTLNHFYSEMQIVVNECGGKIWEYIGDAQMIIFGEKTDGRYPPECQVKPEYAHMNPADQAVHASLNMCKRLEELNVEAQEKGLPVLDIGIGVNTGPVSMGTIKNKGKLVFAAIGDATNVAARMQAMSKELKCRVLVSEHTFKCLEETYVWEKVENVKVKGKAEPMTVYRILSAEQSKERESATISS